MVEKTKDVETLLGNPKKAMLAMAIPVIISMVVQNANNLIDTAWVAGLGTSALAAVGFAFPLFFIIISVANGIGIGSSSAIARFIGMGDHESANRTAGQAVILTIMQGFIICRSRRQDVSLKHSHRRKICVCLICVQHPAVNRDTLHHDWPAADFWLRTSA